MHKMSSRNLTWMSLVSGSQFFVIKMHDLAFIGWISKAVLFPLLKACFSSHLKENEIKHLLTSQHFKSLVCMNTSVLWESLKLNVWSHKCILIKAVEVGQIKSNE